MPCFCKNKVIGKGKVFKESILSIKEKKEKGLWLSQGFSSSRGNSSITSDLNSWKFPTLQHRQHLY